MDYNPRTPSEFNQFKKSLLEKQKNNKELFSDAIKLHQKKSDTGYFLQHEYCGLPILQTPADILQLHSLIWSKKPTLIIETGIARGGSILFYASQLLMLKSLNIINLDPQVIGIDILIHEYNRKSIQDSPFNKVIKLIENSSINHHTYKLVENIAKNHPSKIIILDSNHTYEHVLNELKLYSNLCNQGDLIIVFDTLIEYLDNYFPGSYDDRPWGKSNNPLTAVEEFLSSRSDFIRVNDIDDKLILSGAIGGWLMKK